MDYKEIYDSSVKELEEVKRKKAVLEEQIKTEALALGLDIDSPLKLQIDELQEKLNKEHEELTTKLNDVVTKLEALTVSDEQSEG